jgi:multisite-specific tRNA:(cytosine-C5)-methyltransferase
LATDFKDADEFKQFIDITKRQLPVSFRVNPVYPNYQKLVSMLEDKDMLFSYFLNPGDITKEDVQDFIEKYDTDLSNIKFEKAEWYPSGLVYVLNMSKHGLKKAKALKKFHRLIQISNDCGLLTRQECVSMLPPLFLNVQKDDLVLDMCAAPGSKTSQILELFAAEKKLGSLETLLTGGVVANDMNKKRAYMLTH